MKIRSKDANTISDINNTSNIVSHFQKVRCFTNTLDGPSCEADCSKRQNLVHFPVVQYSKKVAERHPSLKYILQQYRKMQCNVIVGHKRRRNSSASLYKSVIILCDLIRYPPLVALRAQISRLACT